MKKGIFTTIIILAVNLTVLAQVGIGTITPAGGSILDIKSQEKGLLIPRLNIIDLTTIDPVTGGNPEGLMVYNTNATTGKGFYFWNSSYWERVRGKLRTEYDVIIGYDSESDFVCDGVDDNVQFQQAINSLPSSGGSIYIKSGVYSFSSDVVIDSKQNILIKGNGSNTRINNNDQTAIVVDNSSDIKIDNLSMRTGNIVLLRSSYCDFNRLDVRNCSDAGILLDGQSGVSSFNVVRNSLFINNSGVGISQNKAEDSKIIHNTMVGNGLEGLTIDNESHRCIVQGNRIASNNGGVGQVGIDLSDLCTISNNIITGAVAVNLPGITFQNNLGFTNFNTINNNVIIDNPGGGILLKNNVGTCNSNVISSNIFRSNGNFSVIIDTSNTGNIISSNILGGNPINDMGTSTINSDNQ